MTAPPLFPVGPMADLPAYSDEGRRQAIDVIRDAPARLRGAVDGLDPAQLDTRYKNWTVRQIVHHLADSHLHSIIRFKWALSEEHPTIKAYQEGVWAELADSRTGDIEPPLRLLEGLHCKWTQLLESMTARQYDRTFLHPETGNSVGLWTALNEYAWHGRHHTGQILWLREQHGWRTGATS